MRACAKQTPRDRAELMGGGWREWTTGEMCTNLSSMCAQACADEQAASGRRKRR